MIFWKWAHAMYHSLFIIHYLFIRTAPVSSSPARSYISQDVLCTKIIGFVIWSPKDYLVSKGLFCQQSVTNTCGITTCFEINLLYFILCFWIHHQNNPGKSRCYKRRTKMWPGYSHPWTWSGTFKSLVSMLIIFPLEANSVMKW